MKAPRLPAGPEFSRRVELARLGALEAVYPLTADAREREALARRFDLLALDRLEAEVRLHRLSGEIVQVRGELAAEVVQACVVSLEPVSDSIRESFTLLYGPTEPEGEVLIDLETEIVEPFDGTAIDIGEAVAQQLALALDPYPRAAGASLDGVAGAADPAGEGPLKG
jgi:uncharacterized metal-binding protein YceD (DUF177 family)